jgi:hypothetical protein
MRIQRIPLFAVSCMAIMAVTACGRREAEARGNTTSGGANTIEVTDITLGRSINADLTIKDNTTNFRPVDVIYASVETKGAAPATLGVRWTYQDNQVVDQGTREIHPTGPTRTEFHISKPDGLPEGRYRLEVTLNGASAGTKDFEVKR